MRGRWLLLLIVTLAAAPTSAVTLFDGLLGTTPNQQGWFYITNPLTGAAATQMALVDRTVLDTAPVRTEAAGYFSRLVRPPLPPLSHPNMPTLNRALGYSIRFDARLLNELHVTNDRAGFSVIVLSDDLKGIEIGFWADEIWAQNDSPLFTHGEGAAFDTTLDLVTYGYCVSGGSYVLAADGVPILSGAVRDYSSFGAPYDIANFLFLGDDTSSASATVELARVDATPNAVPLAIGNTLHLARSGTSIRVEFAATPGAVAYSLTRDLSTATLGTTPFLSGPAPPFQDDVSLATTDLYFYVAKAVDVCGGTHE